MTKKTCPFCGGEADCGWFAGDYDISCGTCQFSISRHISDFGSEQAAMEAAIAAWNTRVATDAAALREAAEVAYQWWDDDDAQELRDVIRALIPDAGAALDRALEKARAEERDALRNALLEVLAFRAQVAHGNVNLTALARAMTKAEDAIRARSDQGEKE